MKLDIHIGMLLLRFGKQCLCVFLRHITSVIDRDKLGILIHHSFQKLKRGFPDLLALSQDRLVTDSHDVTFLDLEAVHGSIPHCIGHLSGPYPGHFLDHSRLVFLR